jgi:hypothetical protein
MSCTDNARTLDGHVPTPNTCAHWSVCALVGSRKPPAHPTPCVNGRMRWTGLICLRCHPSERVAAEYALSRPGKPPAVPPRPIQPFPASQLHSPCSFPERTVGTRSLPAQTDPFLDPHTCAPPLPLVSTQTPLESSAWAHRQATLAARRQRRLQRNHDHLPVMDVASPSAIHQQTARLTRKAR